MQSFTDIGSEISGTWLRRDCCADSRDIFLHRSHRFVAACTKCFSLRCAINGIIRSTPNSVSFSIAHSIRSKRTMLSPTISGRDSPPSTSSCSENSTAWADTFSTTPRRTACPATISNSCPICARNTRARCAACSCNKVAEFSVHRSAIQRLRVISSPLSLPDRGKKQQPDSAQFQRSNKTEEGALSAPSSVLPLSDSVIYFFLVVFLAAFFVAFFAAFLVAI